MTAGVSSLEVYGFVAWISSYAFLILYLLWASAPTHLLERFGLTFLPSKYWAIAFPVWTSVVVVVYLAAYHALNLALTPSVSSRDCVDDPNMLWPERLAPRQRVRRAHSRGPHAAAPLPAMEDVPPSLVSRVLHGGLSLAEACQLEARRPMAVRAKKGERL